MASAHVIDVSGLAPGGHLHVETPLDVQMEMDLGTTAGPAMLDVDLSRTAAGVEVSGSAEVPVALRCHRCLTDIDEKLELEIDDLVTDDPDDGQPTIVDDRLDLLPIVRDALGLAMPLRPLCKADCQGLCPVCGTDLNSDPCGGHDEAPENPFSVLEHLLDPE